MTIVNCIYDYIHYIYPYVCCVVFVFKLCIADVLLNDLSNKLTEPKNSVCKSWYELFIKLKLS